jgi:hypothetical protein
MKKIFRSLFKYARMGAFAAIVMFVALIATGMTTTGISSLFSSLGISMGLPFHGTTAGDAANEATLSWFNVIINSLIPTTDIAYVNTVISQALTFGVLTLPIFAVYWGTIISFLYEYTYTDNIYGLLIVGIKAMITSLISGGVFLGVDLILKLEMSAITIILLFAVKWIFWGWIANNVTHVKIKGWN